MTSLITLQDIKTNAGMPTSFTTWDSFITGVIIPSVQDELAYLTGITVPAQFTERYDGGQCQIFLRRTPIMTVQSVTENWGYTNFDLVQQDAMSAPAPNVYAYSVEEDQGAITRRTSGNTVLPFAPGKDNVEVTYTAGRSPVPPALYHAGLELATYWLQSSLERSATPQQAYMALETEGFTRSTGITTGYLGIPNRIIQLISPYKRPPVIG